MREVSLFVLVVFGLSFFGGCANTEVTKICNINDSKPIQQISIKNEKVKSYDISKRQASFVGSQIVKLSDLKYKVASEKTRIIYGLKANADYKISIPQQFRNEQSTVNGAGEEITIEDSQLLLPTCYDKISSLYESQVFHRCSFNETKNCSYWLYTNSNGNIKKILTDKGVFEFEKNGIFDIVTEKTIQQKETKTVLPGSFSHELIYNGKDGYNIKVSRREYKDN